MGEMWGDVECLLCGGDVEKMWDVCCVGEMWGDVECLLCGGDVGRCGMSVVWGDVGKMWDVCQ